MLQPVVLAAGASRRMLGKPKALLEFSGRPCLRVVLDAIPRDRMRTPVVVLGSEARAIHGNVDLHDVTVILNEAWALGQTSSVRAGLMALDAAATGVLLLPVDLPLLILADVAAVRDAFEAGSAEADVFVAAHGGRRAHPLVLSRRIFPEVFALLDEQPLHAVVRAVPARVREVPVRNPGILQPMNTPEEYAAVLDEYRVRLLGSPEAPNYAGARRDEGHAFDPWASPGVDPFAARDVDIDGGEGE